MKRGWVEELRKERKEETRQDSRRRRGRREEAGQGGGQKRGSPRTKLKSIGYTSSELKTVPYSYKILRKAVFDEEVGKLHKITEAAPNDLSRGRCG